MSQHEKPTRSLLAIAVPSMIFAAIAGFIYEQSELLKAQESRIQELNSFKRPLTHYERKVTGSF